MEKKRKRKNMNLEFNFIQKLHISALTCVCVCMSTYHKYMLTYLHTCVCTLFDACVQTTMLHSSLLLGMVQLTFKSYIKIGVLTVRWELVISTVMN